MAKEKSDEEYAGVGPGVSGLGKASLYGLVVSIPIALARWTGVLKEKPMLNVAAAATEFGAWVFGFFKGFSQGDAAQTQHRQLVNENKDLRHKTEVLETRQEAVQHALNTDWAERTGKTGNARFAEKTADIPPTSPTR